MEAKSGLDRKAGSLLCTEQKPLFHCATELEVDGKHPRAGLPPTVEVLLTLSLGRDLGDIIASPPAGLNVLSAVTQQQI